MNDTMTQYAGLAAICQQLPLSSLHELHSIINWEISKRLEGFGVCCDEVSVGDVEGENVAKMVGNNVYIGKFGVK